MAFQNRSDAGRQLAARLTMFAGAPDGIVLGLPRGGVPVAYEIANALHLPLEVFLSRKLGVPGNEELAFGAVAEDGARYLDASIIRAAGIADSEVERLTAQARELLRDRALLYRSGRVPLSLDGRRVILVDDGIATGASISVAAHALRQMRPRMLVIAAPVAPRSTCVRLQREVDLLTVLHMPEQFYAVGQFYVSFPQTTDEEVIELLARATRAETTIE